MRPGERLLRLLWVLLLVPMLGVLGLDLQRLQLDREQTVDRTPLSSLDATRHEPGKVSPGEDSPQHGRSREHGQAVLPPQTDVVVYGPDVHEALSLERCAGPHGHARRRPWQARGPPIA